MTSRTFRVDDPVEERAAHAERRILDALDGRAEHEVHRDDANAELASRTPGRELLACSRFASGDGQAMMSMPPTPASITKVDRDRLAGSSTARTGAPPDIAHARRRPWTSFVPHAGTVVDVIAADRGAASTVNCT